MNSTKGQIGFIITCITLSFAMLLSSFSENTRASCIEEEPLTMGQYTFAITLQPSANNSLISYWVVGEFNGKIVSQKPLTETNFILQMQGKQYSKANKYGEDLFQKIALDSCFYSYNDKNYECDPLQYYKLDDLWTLRYNRNPECPEGCTPHDGMRVIGLAANKTYPSEGQMKILNNYGVNHHTDFFYGENMFKMFSDINDYNWTESYRSSK